jgi:hypothetical protein
MKTLPLFCQKMRYAKAKDADAATSTTPATSNMSVMTGLSIGVRRNMG